MLAPLRIRPFSRLLISYFLNYAGDLIGLVALSVLVYAETGSALATSALFIATQFLPALVSPGLTARLDRHSARMTLAAVYLAEGAIYAGLALTAEHFSLLLILGLALADGALSLTARGLIRAAVNATLSPHDQLRPGNAILNVAFAASLAGGAALGGVIVAGVGVTGALIVDAASFVVVSVVLISSSHMPATAGSSEPFLAHLREGFRRVRDDVRTRLLVAGEAAAVFFFALIVPIEVVYAKETLETNSLGFGVLLSSWGFGCVLGSMAFIRLRSGPLLRLILLSTAAIGFAYLGMAGVQDLIAACAFSVLGGFGNGIQWVAVMTIVQESTPADLQARVTGLLESATSITTGIGFLLGGIVVSLASPPVAYAVSGIGVLVLVIAGTLGGTRLIRRTGAGAASTPSAAPSAYPHPPVREAAASIAGDAGQRDDSPAS